MVIYVAARVRTEPLDIGEGEDELTYAGPIRVNYEVTLGWQRGGIDYNATESGELETEVGQSGLDPTTVEARVKIRSALYGALGKLARRVGRQAHATHKEILAAGELTIWRESGEVGPPPEREPKGK